jgi:hypothetical protein
LKRNPSTSNIVGSLASSLASKPHGIRIEDLITEIMGMVRFESGTKPIGGIYLPTTNNPPYTDDREQGVSSRIGRPRKYGSVADRKRAYREKTKGAPLRKYKKTKKDENKDCCRRQPARRAVSKGHLGGV